MYINNREVFGGAKMLEEIAKIREIYMSAEMQSEAVTSLRSPHLCDVVDCAFFHSTPTKLRYLIVPIYVFFACESFLLCRD